MLVCIKHEEQQNLDLPSVFKRLGRGLADIEYDITTMK